MKYTLKARTGRQYGLYDKDGKAVYAFNVFDPKKRVKIDPLQGQEVDFDEDIKPLVGKDVELVELEEAGEKEVEEKEEGAEEAKEAEEAEGEEEVAAEGEKEA